MDNSKQPFLANPLSPEVVERTMAAVKALRENPASPRTGRLAIQAIHDMMEYSLKYYFFTPMDDLGIGAFSRNLVKMGVNAGLGVLNTFGGKLVNTLSTEQKVRLADHLEGAIRYLDPVASGAEFLQTGK